MPDNPKGYNIKNEWGLIKGIKAGEAYIREYIASYFCHYVPKVIIVLIKTKYCSKIGSLIEYIYHHETSSDYGPNCFNAPVLIIIL